MVVGTGNRRGLGELVWRSVISYAVAPYGWDALWYHLTTVATWVTAGGSPSCRSGCGRTSSPPTPRCSRRGGGVHPHECGVDGMQLPFGVLGAVAVMSLARTVGVSRSGAVGAGSMSALHAGGDWPRRPPTTSTSRRLRSFSPVSAFGVRFVAVGGTDVRLRWRLALLCGIAGGLAIGTKTTSAAGTSGYSVWCSLWLR